MWYFILEKRRRGGSASCPVQRVSGWCEGIWDDADGRPGAVFLNGVGKTGYAR